MMIIFLIQKTLCANLLYLQVCFAAPKIHNGDLITGKNSVKANKHCPLQSKRRTLRLSRYIIYNTTPVNPNSKEVPFLKGLKLFLVLVYEPERYVDVVISRHHIKPMI